MSDDDNYTTATDTTTDITTDTTRRTTNANKGSFATAPPLASVNGWQNKHTISLKTYVCVCVFCGWLAEQVGLAKWGLLFVERGVKIAVVERGVSPTRTQSTPQSSDTHTFCRLKSRHHVLSVTLRNKNSLRGGGNHFSGVEPRSLPTGVARTVTNYANGA